MHRLWIENWQKCLQCHRIYCVSISVVDLRSSSRFLIWQILFGLGSKFSGPAWLQAWRLGTDIFLWQLRFDSVLKCISQITFPIGLSQTKLSDRILSYLMCWKWFVHWQDGVINGIYNEYFFTYSFSISFISLQTSKAYWKQSDCTILSNHPWQLPK